MLIIISLPGEGGGVIKAQVSCISNCLIFLLRCYQRKNVIWWILFNEYVNQPAILLMDRGSGKEIYFYRNVFGKKYHASMHNTENYVSILYWTRIRLKSSVSFCWCNFLHNCCFCLPSIVIHTALVLRKWIRLCYWQRSN